MRSSLPAASGPAGDPAPVSEKPDGRRRRLLLALGAGGAGAAAAALASAPAAIAAPDKAAPAASDAAGYRETEHVRDYYRTTRM